MIVDGGYFYEHKRRNTWYVLCLFNILSLPPVTDPHRDVLTQLVLPIYCEEYLKKPKHHVDVVTLLNIGSLDESNPSPEYNRFTYRSATSDILYADRLVSVVRMEVSGRSEEIGVSSLVYDPKPYTRVCAELGM